MAAVMLVSICLLSIWHRIMAPVPAPAVPPCPDCGRAMEGLPTAARGRCTLCADTAERR